MHISGLTVDHDEAELHQLIERGKVAYQLMGERAGRMAREAKQGSGWSGYSGGAPY